MPLEAATQRITLTGRGWDGGVQMLTEGDMIVPDVNPDIYQILKTGERIVIDSVRPEQGRICFSGRIEVSVLYYGKKTEHPVSFMKTDFPVEDCIEAPGVTPETDADVTAEIIHTDYRLANDRKINVKAVASAKAAWTNSREEEVMTGVGGGEYMQTKTGEITPGTVSEKTAEEFTVREELSLPSDRPDMAEIVEASADICRREIRFSQSQAQIRGEIRLNIIYIDPDGGLETAEFTLPLSFSVDVPSSEGENYYIVSVRPAEIKAEIASDDRGEPRAVDAEITVTAAVKSFGDSVKTVLQDAYSLSSPLKIEREEGEYIELCGKNRAQASFRDTISLEEEQPDMLQTVKAWGSLRNTESSVSEDTVTVEGTADIKLMYIAKDDERPINVVEKSVPFSHAVEIIGAREGMIADVVTEIEDISVSLMSEREAEIRLTLSFDAAVCGNKKFDFIRSVSEDEAADEVKSASGAVIYTVRDGDSLWEIAKKYNTTIDDILSVNSANIENGDMVYPGQRLLILKKFV